MIKLWDIVLCTCCDCGLLCMTVKMDGFVIIFAMALASNYQSKAVFLFLFVLSAG